MGNLSIGTNVDNDIYLGPDGNLVMVNGIEALKQDCEHAMKAQRGEMFLQPTDGLPTFDDVWLSKNFLRWQAVAQDTLLAINGIVRIEDFTTSVQGENFVYEVQLLTVYSPTLLTIAGTLGN